MNIAGVIGEKATSQETNSVNGGSAGKTSNGTEEEMEDLSARYHQNILKKHS
jgi:hypothetical protein